MARYQKSWIALVALVTLGLILLVIAQQSNAEPNVTAQQNGEHQLYIPGLARNAADQPPTPTPTQTESPTATAPAGPDGFEIYWIDVGQGDATLVVVNGERLLVDGG